LQRQTRGVSETQASRILRGAAENGLWKSGQKSRKEEVLGGQGSNDLNESVKVSGKFPAGSGEIVHVAKEAGTED
jgi:hypothetical protein